ncbi:MAG TPA: O-antigen ligase family protein [Alphaproteobacteria bacterium]|jgi:O-antigen ligase
MKNRIGTGPVSDATQRLFLLVLVVLTGVVIPLLVIGRGAASILVPIIGGMVAVLIAFAEPEQRRRLWPGSALGWAIAVMLSVQLLSAIFSIKLGFSLTIWLQLAGLLLLTGSLPHFLAEGPDLLPWTLRILVTASVVCTAIAVISIFMWPPLLGYVRPVDTPTAYFSALRLKSYGAVMPCLAPVLLWAGFRLGGFWRSTAIVAVILGAMVVYGTNNRAALGGYAGAAGFVLLAVLLKQASAISRILIVLAFVAAAGAVGLWVISHLPPMPFEGAQSMRLPTWLVDAHRQVIWGFVLDRALERPWLGWGLSTSNFVPGANDAIPGIGQTFVPLHPHNWVLQLFCESGIVGLAAASAALLLFLRALFRSAVSGQRAGWAALGLSGAFFVSALANFSIWQGWWQSVFVVLMSVVLTGCTVAQDERAPAGARAERGSPAAAGNTRAAAKI